MIRFLELLIAIVIVVVIVVLVGLVLPWKRHVEFPTETNRPLPVVFDMLSGFQRFKDWTPMKNQDPNISIKVSGPESGKGARMDYTSANPAIGSGSWEVAEVVPGEKIVYNLTNGDYGSNKTMTFRFKKVGNQKRSIEVKQSYDVDYGANLLGHYAGLYVSRSVGDPMRTGLNNMTNLLATIPKYDYTELNPRPTIVKTPAESVLVADTEAKRTDADLATAMESEEKWLRQAIEKNGLEAAGPLRIITDNYGASNYKFAVAIPVRKKGEAPDAAPAPIDLKLDAGSPPIKVVQNPEGKAITTKYTGHMGQLVTIRAMMQAWAATHGATIAERPYEQYVKGVPMSFSPEGEFVLFWPLKAPGAK